MKLRKIFTALLFVTVVSFYSYENVCALQMTPGITDAKIYNVCDFGAVGDGTTLNTKAIQSAIDACHSDSGGTVIIPVGNFLSGTLELKSNVTFLSAANY